MRKSLLLLAVLLLTVGVGSAADPVAYYKLDGDFTDSAGSNDGTNNGGTSFDVGYWNQSGSFDGVDDYVKANDVFEHTATSNYSISFWFNAESVDGEYIILSQSSGLDSPLCLFEIRDEYPRVFFRTDAGGPDGDFVVDYKLSANTWYHWVITKQAENVNIYINGEEVDSKTYTHTGTYTFDRLVIGCVYRSSITSPFKGEIDDVKIYDLTLSPSEVLTVYQNSIHNSFILSAYDELNQTELNISSFTIYNENQSVSSGTLIDGNYYVYSNQFAALGQYITTINVDGYYSRNFIVENQYKPSIVSTYLPPEAETVIYEQFTLNDNVALYDSSDIILRLDKPMGDDTNTIYSSYFDMNSQASTYLIPNNAYILYIITPDETINYGWLYPDADGAVTIILNAFEFEESENWLDYTYECTDTAVSFDYTSTASVDAASFIVSYQNGTEAYNVSADTDTGSFTYNFLGNATYKIDISVDTEIGDSYSMQKFIEIGKSNQIDFFPSSYSLMLKSICVMFGIIIGVIGLSSYRSDLSAIWAFAFYAFAVYQGWIFGNAITVSILGIIAIAAIKKFQKREARMG